MLLSLVVAPVDAADWPVERGDQQGTGVAKSALPAEPELLWKYEAEETAFEATPVVVGGVVYLGDVDGAFHAVGLGDGKQRWQVEFEDTGFLSAAAARSDRLVVGDFDGRVRCLATEDGAELWSFDAETEVYAGPVFHGKNVLVTTEGGTLYAIDLESGEQRWKFVSEAPLRCSPTIVEGRILLAGCDARLHAIDADSGKELASVEIGAATGNTAASRDGRSFFGTEGGAFLGVDAKGGLEVAWTYIDQQRPQGIRTAAAVSDRAAVFANQGKVVYSVDPANGERLWRAPMRSRVEAAPVITGKRVAVATSRGRVLLLSLADGATAWQYDAGGSFLAAPAVVDGKLLIASDDGVLYCFGEKH